MLAANRFHCGLSSLLFVGFVVHSCILISSYPVCIPIAGKLKNESDRLASLTFLNPALLPPPRRADGVRMFLTDNSADHIHPRQINSSMKNDRISDRQKIVLVGGGHAHVQVVRALNQPTRPRNVDVLLIDINSSATYSGMVPGCVGKLYQEKQTFIHLKPLTKWAGVEFLQREVVDIDPDSRMLYLKPIDRVNGSHKPSMGEDQTIREQPRSSADSIHFDVASFDIGSTSRGLHDDGEGAWRNYVIPTRPINHLLGRIEAAEQKLLSRKEEQESRSMKYGIHDDGHVDVVVVGGGVAGVELSLSIQERWRSLTRNLSITILDSGALLLPTESDDCGSTLSRLLFERNVVVRFNSVVKEVKSNELTLVDGSDVPFNHCLWATGAAAHTFANKTLRDRGVAVNENGWIRVRPSLQSVSHAHIFASGDCSNIEGLPNRKSPPKAGLYAVRAGPILIRNLVAFLGYHNEGLGNDCSDLINYSPQDDFLKLIGCGDGTAVGFRFGFAMQGKWVWKMKDHIDRTFMDLFAEEKLPTLSKVEDNGTLQYGHREKCDSEILPCKAGTLLLRTDDNVDYKMASKILQHMKDSDEYRKAVLSAMLEHRYQSNFRPCSS